VRLSIQAIDCAFGVPASNVEVSLLRQTDTGWLKLADARTGSDGQLVNWPPEQLNNGEYQLLVCLEDYYSELGTIPLHLRAMAEFRITDPTVDLHLSVLVTTNSFQVYGLLKL
jgi:5-hydroxyisourate hydrolase-like protein (transthyretin family)